jgi:DNA-binding transcriptional LysR family regulator
MNINNINFTAFIRVAEAGSFNKAAESLYITSTALIKQINLLEPRETSVRSLVFLY